MKMKDFVNATIYGTGSGYNKVLNISKKKYSDNTLSEANPNYDVFLVGSDQVWNFSRKLSYAYLLGFVDKKKRKVAYAVSMGQGHVPSRLYDELRQAISSFNHISCREDNAVAFINELAGDGAQAKQCVDPTLLIPGVSYENISVKPKNRDFVVSYILNQLDAGQRDEIVRFCDDKKLPLVNLRNPDTCIRMKSAQNKVVTPYQWLGYMMESGYVVCGSFHATVFALIFHKQFVVIETEETYAAGGNKRIRSLLRPLGLEYRCICHGDISAVIEREIDWKDVDTQLESMREESIGFLCDSLA